MAERFALVPVLDLKSGRVVHARAGERSRYQPIRSALTPSSEAGAVLDALLSLAPFRHVYIADLDAIQGEGEHRRLIAELARRHPALELWVDAGLARAADAQALAGEGLVPVMGSETLADPAELEAVAAALGPRRWLLSLDYRGDRFLGPPGLAAAPERWPERVIVMTLSRVGSGGGPDLARLGDLSAVAGAGRLLAAGGVRDAADLAGLAGAGYAGALIASALHDGRLSGPALAPYG